MAAIGIIGAGISGLATAKIFRQRGHEVTVIEKAATIGGVWNPDRSYPGVTTQTTRDEYAFSDFPMPAHYPQWPTGEQVHAYLTSYALHFGIIPLIRFNTLVTALYEVGNSWHMDIHHLASNTTETLHFHAVMICTGTFHAPAVPDIPGQDTYLAAGGVILHSSQVLTPACMENKSVAVTGNGKSAIDLAIYASNLARDTTLLYRKAKWKVPAFFANILNVKYLLFSRFSEALFIRPPHATPACRLFHRLARPLIGGFWRMMEVVLKNQFRLKACNLLPSSPLEDGISCGLSLAPTGFYKKIKEGAISARCTEILRFEDGHVLLKDGGTLTPDLVIMATGYHQHLPFLDERYRQLLTDEHGLYRLFRNILHPDIPRLGFIGFNSSIFTPLTSEMAAHWMARYIDNVLHLPSLEEMHREIAHMNEWRHSVRPVSMESAGTCIIPFNYLHLDQLMRDMGLRATATRWWIYEFFKPINPKDYHKILNAGK